MDTGQSDFHGPSFAPSNMLLDPVISRTPCEGGGEGSRHGGGVLRGGRLEAVEDILRYTLASWTIHVVVQARSIIDETEWRSL